MALTLHSDETRSVTVAEYLDYIETNVDPFDQASIIESAPMLKALSNNKGFLADFYNAELRQYSEDLRRDYFLSPQSYIIGSNKAGNLILRSNVWTVPSKDADRAHMESRLFSYNTAHDHNFDFMTVGYYGPGYETIIYEYDNSVLDGYIGEKVNLHFCERTTLPMGKLMYYRATKDVHIQLPPPSLSISLNLLVSSPESFERAQYHIDVNKQEISAYPDEALVSRRVALMNFAAQFNNDTTATILHEILEKSHCVRTKMAAVNSLAKMGSDNLLAFENFAKSSDPVIRNHAIRMIDSFSAA